MSVEDSFFDNFSSNIEKLDEFIRENNNKHIMSNENKTSWIEAQPDNINIKRACRLLVDNTIYVTFDETVAYIESLIDKYYPTYLASGKEIHMFIGENNKSNYFLSILALRAILSRGYPPPSKFLKTLPNDEYFPESKILLYFDDMTYSGGQILIYTNKLYTIVIKNSLKHFISTNSILNSLVIDKSDDMRIIIEKMKATIDKLDTVVKTELLTSIVTFLNETKYYDIEYLLLGINSSALTRLMSYSVIQEIKDNVNELFRTNVYNPNSEYGELIYKIKNEFHYGVIYKTIDELMDERDIFLISYYFSFGRVPNVMVYFDYKIADVMSTFTRVLNYGLVVPENFDIKHYWPPFASITDEAGYNNVKQSGWYRSPISVRYFELCKKYYHTVAIDESQDITLPLKFSNLVENCEGADAIRELINTEKINYLMVISEIPGVIQYSSDKKILPPSPSLTKHAGEYIPTPNMPHFELSDLIHLYYRDNKEEIFKILQEMENNRCELSFYKNKLMLKGGKRKTMHSKKLSRGQLTRKKRRKITFRNKAKRLFAN